MPVVTDNHPVGSHCLAQRSVTEIHLENAEVQCEEAVEVRKRIWAEILRAVHVWAMRVHAKTLREVCCFCCLCLFHGGRCRLIAGYELKLIYLMGSHVGMIMDCGKFLGKKKQCNKWIETGSEVKIDGVNGFTRGLLEYLEEKILSNSSKSKSCPRKWRREASYYVSLFLIAIFLFKNRFNIILFWSSCVENS